MSPVLCKVYPWPILPVADWFSSLFLTSLNYILLKYENTVRAAQFYYHNIFYELLN